MAVIVLGYSQKGYLAKCAWKRGNYIKEKKKQAVRGVPGGLSANCAWPGNKFLRGCRMRHPEQSDNDWGQKGESPLRSRRKPG